MRLWLANLICPSTHRLIEVGDVVEDPRTAANDLIRGGDALARGWGCDPAILYKAAALLRTKVLYLEPRLHAAMANDQRKRSPYEGPSLSCDARPGLNRKGVEQKGTET